MTLVGLRIKWLIKESEAEKIQKKGGKEAGQRCWPA
jgi:hypothetical protein